MSNWKNYNLFMFIVCGLLSLICIAYLDKAPILILPGVFMIGMFYKCVKNIIVGSPKTHTTNSSYRNYNNKKKKSNNKAR